MHLLLEIALVRRCSEHSTLAGTPSLAHMKRYGEMHQHTQWSSITYYPAVSSRKSCRKDCPKTALLLDYLQHRSCFRHVMTVVTLKVTAGHFMWIHHRASGAWNGHLLCISLRGERCHSKVSKPQNIYTSGFKWYISGFKWYISGFINEAVKPEEQIAHNSPSKFHMTPVAAKELVNWR